MLRLVKTTEKPRPATGLTMGGPPPQRIPNPAPGLTYAQEFAGGQKAASRPALRVVSSQA